MIEAKIKIIGGLIGIAGIAVWIISVIFLFDSFIFAALQNKFTLLTMVLVSVLLTLFTVFAFLGERRSMILSSCLVLLLCGVAIFSLFFIFIKYSDVLRYLISFDASSIGIGKEAITKAVTRPYFIIIRGVAVPFIPIIVLNIFYIFFAFKFCKSKDILPCEGAPKSV